MYFLFLFTVLWFFSIFNTIEVKAISYQISLEKKLADADFVVEGYIEQKNSFYSEENGLIYSVNSLVITKVFKGDGLQESIGLLTVGGKIDDVGLETCPSEDLPLGMYGIFLLKTMNHKLKGIDKTEFYMLPTSKQSVYQYDFHNATASDGFSEISFNQIYSQFGLNYKEINKLQSLMNSEDINIKTRTTKYNPLI